MKITHVTTQNGQPRPYADSLYSADITADEGATDAEVWAYCQTIRPAQNRDDKAMHTGACGFRFGLSSFGSLRKITSSTYRYSVTEPYCD